MMFSEFSEADLGVVPSRKHHELVQTVIGTAQLKIQATEETGLRHCMKETKCGRSLKLG